MACNITSNILQDCSYFAGSIKELYLANYAEVSGFTTDSTGVITGATMSGAATFFEYQASTETAGFTQELVVSGDKKFFNQTLTFNIQGLTQLKNNEMENLFLAKMVAIAVDYNGRAWLLGWSNPLRATAGSANIGAALTDDNGYVVTLSTAQTQLAPEVDEAIIAGLL